MEVDQPPLCILCTKPCDDCDSISRITNEKWQNIESKSAGWSGLDKYGTAYETTRWENGPAGFYMHASCYTTLSNPVKLQQAKKRKEKLLSVKEEEKENVETSACSVYHDDEDLSSKRRRSDGSLHDKTKCVWRFSGDDERHPGRKFSKLSLISTQDAWSKFKQHTVLLEDQSMRSRIVTLINFVDSGTDPFAVEIRYHLECWLQYVSHPKLSDQDHLHLQNVTLMEAKSLFFRHVKEVIFENHEIRTLQSLVKDYQKTLFNFNHDASGTKLAS